MSLLAAASLVVLDALIRAVRIRTLTAHPASLSLSRAVVANAFGDAASALTPARLGGEPMRFVWLTRAGVSGGTAMVALAAERVIDLSLVIAVALALGVGFGGTVGRGVSRLAEEASSTIGLALLGAVGILIVISLVAARAFRRRVPRPIAHSLGSAWTAARALTTRRFVMAVVLTGLSMAARTAILPVLAVSVGRANLDDVVLGSFALLYGQLVVPTPAGAGAVELGFIGGFAGALPAAQLAGLLATWRFFTLAFGPLIGVGIYALVRLRQRFAGNVIAGALTLLIAAAVPQGGSAQTASQLGSSEASRLLPTDHWANEYIRLLRARGLLENLNPLVQPYRRASVVQGLASVDPDTLREPVAGWVRLLKEEFRSQLDRPAERSAPTWGATVSAGGRASTSRRLDPLRPLGDEGAWPWYRLGAWAEAGPIVAEARLLGDNYLADAPNGSGDPDGLDPGQRRGGRTDHAYVAAQFSAASLVLGRFKRNWSLVGNHGLLVSDAATAYPQLEFELRAGRFTLRSFTGELGTINDRKRLVAAHRIDYTRDDLVVSLGESILYAPDRGGFSLRFLNPLELLFFDHDNAPNDATQNLMVDAQVWLRRGGVVLHAEALLDDIDVRPSGPEAEPPVYALVLSAEVPAVTAALGFRVDYRQVSAWAYRTPNVIDRYSYLERGLGDNYSDYDRLTLAADLHVPVGGLRITPLVAFQRRGQGDLRDSMPTGGYVGQPAIFFGQKETTYRLGLRGRYQPNRYVWLAWDVGENFVRNARHVAGDKVTEFSGTAEVGVRVEF